MIRKTILTILTLAVLIVPASAVDKTVILTWNANTESDMAGYTGYRYSSSSDTTVDETWTVAHPTTTKSTVISVPDNSSISICFELDAFDLAGNHSAKSSRVCTTVTGNDTAAPGPPTNVRITVSTTP
jgi:hypothetical protein